MLKSINSLPTDKRIAGVHCIPFDKYGNLFLAWDREEKLLTTIGGRIENDENIDQALEREVFEEVGITIGKEKRPFAAWYWESTDTYTVWYLAKVKEILPYKFEHEKTGYMISNIEVFIDLISKLEPENGTRIKILQLAKAKAQEEKWNISLEI